jgi:hypothetical protein
VILVPASQWAFLSGDLHQPRLVEISLFLPDWSAVDPLLNLTFPVPF